MVSKQEVGLPIVSGLPLRLEVIQRICEHPRGSLPVRRLIIIDPHIAG
jgi:hypothetical protein